MSIFIYFLQYEVPIRIAELPAFFAASENQTGALDCVLCGFWFSCTFQGNPF